MRECVPGGWSDRRYRAEAPGPAPRLSGALGDQVIGAIGGGVAGAAMERVDGSAPGWVAGAIGGGAAGATMEMQQAFEQEQVDAAIALIETSQYATTTAGQAVLAEIKKARAFGKISFVHFASPRERGAIAGDDLIQIKADFLLDPRLIASELVHEGAHLVLKTWYPGDRGTVDDEHFALENQIQFYWWDQKKAPSRRALG